MFSFLKPNRPSKRDAPPVPRVQPDHPHKRLRPLSTRVHDIGSRISRIFERSPGPVPEPEPEYEKLRGDVGRVRKDERKLKEKVGELSAEIAKIEQRLSQRVSRREESARVTKELAVAQRFLSTADSLSQAEVVRAVEALNEEIFQLTSIVADKVQVTERHLQEPERQEMFRQRVLLVGPLAAFLQVVEPKHLEDSLAIQIGWQAILVQWCSMVIQAWVPSDLQLSKDLNELHEKIASHNDQAVAGRWRALCFSVSNGVSSDTRTEMSRNVIRALAALPVLCGYISSQKVHTDLATEFEQRTGPLLDKCLKLRKMIGEGITSTNIQSYFLNSGDPYDPSSADLEYEDEGGAEQEKQGIIACSLGLGLYLTRTVSGNDGKIAESREPVLKPKVILQETLAEIIA